MIAVSRTRRTYRTTTIWIGLTAGIILTMKAAMEETMPANRPIMMPAHGISFKRRIVADSRSDFRLVARRCASPAPTRLGIRWLLVVMDMRGTAAVSASQSPFPSVTDV